ncbi:hypothetical protein MA16_Dca006872 [Dendrobium catenatum]|uniref:Uncharacterized protein n=1 Tax=Dendrobium catenatum TaxID=906689 RepID=A0A2I0VT17_9ASPA|nr:hypothetical protein MA16_Dca006872 [Dendrobium catenatum]
MPQLKEEMEGIGEGRGISGSTCTESGLGPGPVLPPVQGLGKASIERMEGEEKVQEFRTPCGVFIASGFRQPASLSRVERLAARREQAGVQRLGCRAAQATLHGGGVVNHRWLVHPSPFMGPILDPKRTVDRVGRLASSIRGAQCGPPCIWVLMIHFLISFTQRLTIEFAYRLSCCGSEIDFRHFPHHLHVRKYGEYDQEGSFRCLKGCLVVFREARLMCIGTRTGS